MGIRRAELVAINIPTGATAKQYNFPDNASLRTTDLQTIFTRGIEFYPQEAFGSTGTAPDGTSLMGQADLLTGFLNLYINEGWYFTAPICSLIRVGNGSTAVGGNAIAAPNYTHVITNLTDQLEDLIITWAKSYVIFPAAVTANRAILCNVYYDSVDTAKGIETRLQSNRQ